MPLTSRPSPISLLAVTALAASMLAAGCGGDAAPPAKPALAPATARTAAGELLVRIQGGSTWNEALRPHLAEIEQRSGQKVDLVGSDSWRGLCNVVEGRADIAALSLPLDQVVAELSRRRPGIVKPGALHATPLRPIEITFVTHASNPVKKLSAAQLQGIFTGKITSWKKVGGDDLSIRVVLPGKAEGTRDEVRRRILDGAEFTPDALEEPRAALVDGTVSAEPRAIGWIPVDHPREGLNAPKIAGGPATLQLPLILVTVGEPTPEVRWVLDAVAALRDKL